MNRVKTIKNTNKIVRNHNSFNSMKITSTLIIALLLVINIPVVFADFILDTVLMINLSNAENESMQDVAIEEGNPNTNFDEDLVYAKNYGGANTDIGFWMFNISKHSLPYDDTYVTEILDAEFQIKVYDSQSDFGEGIVDVHSMMYGSGRDATFDETTVTYGAGNPCNGDDFSTINASCNATKEASISVVNADNGKVKSYNVTNMTQRAVKTTNLDNLTIIMTSTSANRMHFYSKDMSNPALRHAGALIIYYKISMMADETVPTVTQLSINNSLTKRYEDILVSALLTDETQLDSWRIAHNVSGIMSNQSINDISGTSQNVTYNFTDDYAQDTVVGYQFWVNDTSGNIAISSIYTFSVSDNIPYFASHSINNSLAKTGEDILVSIEAVDDTALSWIILSHNISGTITNQTAFAISGTAYNYTYVLTATTKNKVIGYQFWLNDTSNNINISDIYTLQTINTAPQTATIIYPTVDLRTNEMPLAIQVTFAEDADTDAITIYYYINDTLNVTSANNISLQADDGYYNLKVSLTDDEEFSANVSVNFEIDTINPILTITSPIATSYNSNITVNVTCTDASVYLLNYTVFNSTYQVIQSKQNSSPIGEQLLIKDLIDITELPDGNYVFNVSCSDSHTKNKIDDYYITYQENGIMYDTTEGNRIKILQLGKPATASTIKNIDKYEFYFGTSEEKEQRTYKVISMFNDIHMIKDSEYNAHLVIYNKQTRRGNWIDFESTDAEIISIKQINPAHVEITVQATDFNFKSIGGLNVVTDTVLFTIGTAIEEEEEEEDTVLSATLFLGSIGIIITLILIMFISTYKSIRGKK